MDGLWIDFKVNRKVRTPQNSTLPNRKESNCNRFDYGKCNREQTASNTS